MASIRDSLRKAKTGTVARCFAVGSQRKFPLLCVLVIPYVVQLGAAVSLVGWLSLKYGHQAVERVSMQYREELAERIGDQLTHQMKVPFQINQLNLASSHLGLFNWTDRTQLGRLFWQQMHIFSQVGYINYASAQRDFTGVERLDDGTLVVHQSSSRNPSSVLSFHSDASGRVLNPQTSYEPDSVLQEGWYADAVKAGKPIWSSIYAWQDKPNVLSISASVPIYGPSRQLQGVLGVDLILTQLGNFLQHLSMTPSAKAFLIEPDGLLVANSVGEPLVQKVDGQMVRKAAIASQDPLIRATVQSMQQQFGHFAQITTAQHFEFQWDGQDQYVQITPWRDQDGLHWLTVVTIPERDLMAELHESNQYTIWVSVAALIMAMISGLFTSRAIACWVQRLGTASRAIAQGQLDQPVQPSKIAELSDLADAFNLMAAQVRNGFTNLESRIQERTLSLQQTEEKFRSIFENASEGIYQTTLDGQYLNANLALAKIYGYNSPQDLIDHISCIDKQLYVDPLDRYTFMQDIANHDQIKEFETQVYCKNGKKIWISENGRAVKDELGKILYYEGTVTDITRRKRAEEALKENALQLRVQNQALMQLAKNRSISEGQIEEALQHITFTATALFSVDRVSVWLYETEPDRLECSVLLDEDFYQPDPDLRLLATDCPIYFKALSSQRLISASEAWIDPRLSELCFVYFNDHQIRSALIVAICKSDGLSGMLCLEQKDLKRDWSFEEENVARSLADLVALAMEARDRKQAEQALAHAKDLAESANRAKSQFLANMSHELRTPLNAIIGFTQVLRRDAALNTEQQEHVNIINRSGEHLLGLINDVLEMSKIEADRLVLEERDFDLNRLLETVEGMFRLKTQEKGIGLNLEQAPQVPRFIRADESKLRQVLINLIGNAVKFTQMGQITIRLSVQALKPQPLNALSSLWQLCVEVADTGPGIAPAELATLFTAFVQTESGRKSQQGTGLGLSISRRFVELMGGHIQVQSRVGEGTLFSFQIPVEAISDLSGSDEMESRVVGIAPNQPPFRILVVDDLPENRWVLVKLLRPLGFEVQEAADGQAAIALSASWLPHLIFMDIRMPVMDGLAATRAIKDNPQAHQPVIIAITASVFDADRHLVETVGCNDFISKPFREAHLMAKIGQHLGVEFVYETRSDAVIVSNPLDESANEPVSQVQVDMAAAITTMPSDWQRRMHQAACCGDDNALQQLVAQMPPNLSHAAQRLDQWVNDFQFAPIIKLTQDILQATS